LATQRAFAASVVLAHGVRWSSQWRGGFEIGGEKFGFPPPLASFWPVSVSSSCPLRVCVCYAWAWHAGRSWLSRHRFFSRPSPVMGLSLVLVVAQRRVLVRELGELVGGVAVDGQPRKTCSTSVATGAAVLCEPTYGVEYDGQSVVCSTSVATGAAVLCTSTEWRCVRRPVGACSAACIGTRADLWRCIQRPVGSGGTAGCGGGARAGRVGWRRRIRRPSDYGFVRDTFLFMYFRVLLRTSADSRSPSVTSASGWGSVRNRE